MEFKFWDALKLTEKLNKPQNIHLRRYWFNELILDNEWFETQLNISIAVAGRRYEPDFHVDLPIAHNLARLGRTEPYIDKIKSYAQEIQKRQRSMERRICPDLKTPIGQFMNRAQLAKYEMDVKEGIRPNIPPPPQDDPNLKNLIDELRGLRGILLRQLFELTPKLVDATELQRISELAKRTIIATEKLVEYSSERTDVKFRKRQHRKNDQGSLEAYPWALGALRSIRKKIKDVRLMVIEGDAGTGKTHLLCKIAEERVKKGLPTVLLMGQLFANRDDAWSQTLKRLDLRDKSVKEFIGALEVAAQRSGHRSLIMIDAINEGEPDAIWREQLAAFLARIDSPWIGVVLSVRSNYKENAISLETLEKAVVKPHKGYGEKTYEAIKKQFARYELELSATSILRQEFRNPLFLKIFCEGAKGQKKQSLPMESDGFSEVFNLYLDAVNTRLAEKLKYDPDENHVRDALRKLTQHLVKKGEIEGYVRGVDKKTVKDIVDQFLPNRSYEQSLYRGMVLEDVFIEDPKPEGHSTQKVVRISYERLADYLIADCLLEENLNLDEPEKMFADDGAMAFLRDEKRPGVAGLVEALSIQVPERTKKELVDIAPFLIGRQDARAGFRQSLIWRNIDAFSDATDKILNGLLDAKDEDTLDTLLAIAIVPGPSVQRQIPT